MAVESAPEERLVADRTRDVVDETRDEREGIAAS
jgi:hypothetical protein